MQKIKVHSGEMIAIKTCVVVKVPSGEGRDEKNTKNTKEHIKTQRSNKVDKHRTTLAQVEDDGEKRLWLGVLSLYARTLPHEYPV